MSSIPTSLSYDARGLSAAVIGQPLGVDEETRRRYDAPLLAARAAVVDAHERRELGFLTCLDEPTDAIIAWADKMRDSGWTDQLVFGIGGSSLGSRAILAAAHDDDRRGLKTHFSENVDPVSVARQLASLPLETTLLIVISKSGTTIETMGNFWITYAQLIEKVGERQAAAQVVAITDPVKGGLRKMADARGFTSFSVPPEVGGRFSVLTAVGLVPLALAGYPIESLMQGARDARKRALEDDVEHNACLNATLDQVLLLERGVNQCVMMTYCDALLPMVDWFRQLWAESLGKPRRADGVAVGITPIAAVGAIDQHSQVQLYMEGPADKHVTFLRVERPWNDLIVPTMEGLPDGIEHLAGKSLSSILEAELVGTRAALESQGRPTSTWTFQEVNPANIGAFILAWELMTAIAGELLDVDAFDQPGVELGKKIAHGLLGRAQHAALAAQYLPQAQGDDPQLSTARSIR